MIAVLVAVASMIAVAVMQSRLRGEISALRLSNGASLLWSMGAEWDSAEMGDVRAAAAADLLSGTSSRDIDDVLGFFDRLALLVDRGVIDDDLACYEFYHPMASFWFASQDYVRKAQQKDPDAWANLSAVMSRLVDAEARRRGTASADVIPNREDLRRFLQDEKDSAPCADEDCDEARRTPL